MMTTTVINGTPTALATAERLDRLAQLERMGLTCSLVAVTVDKLYDHEITEARRKLAGFEVELAEFVLPSKARFLGLIRPRPTKDQSISGRNPWQVRVR